MAKNPFGRGKGKSGFGGSNKAPPFMKTGASEPDADDSVAPKNKAPSPKNMRKGKK
jgi:hypothetical protein